MSGLTKNQTPTVWTEEELASQAQVALNNFVERRLAEPGGVYLSHVRDRRKSIIRLFRALASVDLKNPDLDVVRVVLLDEDLFDSLRYLTGPPVSEDDLGVLVTRKIQRLNKTDLRKSDHLATQVLDLIISLADPVRFPWIASHRRPTLRELRVALHATTALHAAQSLQTARRKYGRVVERQLETRLEELDFQKMSAPNKGQVTVPIHYPAYPKFYGECTVHGRKVDLFIPLPTGKVVALEAKDSSSGLNSVKRLNNDTAAKAKHFAEQAGKNMINVALLSGVFKLDSLISAQESGLYIVWSHSMDGFIEWVKAQTVL